MLPGPFVIRAKLLTQRRPPVQVATSDKSKHQVRATSGRGWMRASPRFLHRLQKRTGPAFGGAV